MRSGVVAKKLGMTQIYQDGAHIAVSVLALDKCAVVDVRTEEKDGYSAVQVGSGLKKISRTTKGEKGHYTKNNVDPRKHVTEFRVDHDISVNVGDEFSVHHFLVGQYVDVTGTSKGKGFAGSMKRHNFGGGRATHGNSLSHRSHGSTGNCQEPGKVWKGKKMAGHMGNRRVTTQNLQIVLVDQERDLLFIKGAVPGADDSYVNVKDAIKKKLAEVPSSEKSFKGQANLSVQQEPEAEAPASREE